MATNTLDIQQRIMQFQIDLWCEYNYMNSDDLTDIDKQIYNLLGHAMAARVADRNRQGGDDSEEH